MGKIVSREDLEALYKETRVVSCANDRDYVVRALSGEEVIEVLGMIPDLAAVRSSAGSTKRTMEVAQGFAIKGLVEPRIGTADGEISIDLVPFGDLMKISSAIQELAGVSPAEAETLRPTLDDEGSS